MQNTMEAFVLACQTTDPSSYKMYLLIITSDLDQNQTLTGTLTILVIVYSPKTLSVFVCQVKKQRKEKS